MAFKQEFIDRYKAEGFYKHVEWNRRNGILVKIYEKGTRDTYQKVTFEAGTHDVDYDQQLAGFRQVFISRKQAVQFMLNMGLNLQQIAETIKQVDGGQIVTKFV